MKYKTDTNHVDIKSALEKCGFFVFDTSRLGKGFPDLFVASYYRVVLMEVKATKESRLTPAEKKFHDSYKGELYIVTTPEEAIKAMGVWRGGA